MNRERYLVSSYGDNEEGTHQGLMKFIQLCEHHGNGVIVVPNIGQVRHSMLVSILGEELSKKLFKDRVLKIESGKKIAICASSTLKNYRDADVYLALWGSEDMIQNIEDSCFAWKSVVLVTWTPSDSKSWRREKPVKVIYDDGKS